MAHPMRNQGALAASLMLLALSGCAPVDAGDYESVNELPNDAGIEMTVSSTQQSLGVSVPTDVLLSVLAYTDAQAGVDRPGGDYAHFNTTSIASCRSACAVDNRCASFTYVGPGIQGASAVCWLKDSIPAQRSAQTAIASGIVRQNGLEYAVNRGGSDYRNFDLGSADPTLCKRACENEASQCKAFSYVRPGVQGPNARCWLKSSVPAARADANVISGRVTNIFGSIPGPILPPTAFLPLKGDTTCEYGDPDCNTCVNDVPRAFAALRNAPSKNHDYSFVPLGSYEPADQTAWSALSVLPGGGAHLQGITRLPIDVNRGDGAWFAMTYGAGHTGKGVVYLVEMPQNTVGGSMSGGGRMRNIHRSLTEHPGGSQAVGNYLFVGHDESYAEFGTGCVGSCMYGFLEVFNLADPTHTVRFRDDLSGSRLSAAAGAKLSDGRGLIVGKAAGSNGRVEVYTTRRVGDPDARLFGTATGGVAAENVSLVTECGSGDLYLFSATGDSHAIYGDNTFSLHKLDLNLDGPVLTQVGSSIKKSQVADCDARAAGTVFATRDHKMHVYCGQKLATDLRMGAKTCLLPYADGCDDKWYSWKCIKEFAKDTFLPGYDCADAIVMDDHMNLREYQLVQPPPAPPSTPPRSCPQGSHCSRESLLEGYCTCVRDEGADP